MQSAADMAEFNPAVQKKTVECPQVDLMHTRLQLEQMLEPTATVVVPRS
jgi:hypothetical protein